MKQLFLVLFLPICYASYGMEYLQPKNQTLIRALEKRRNSGSFVGWNHLLSSKKLLKSNPKLLKFDIPLITVLLT